jgi:hypothetical protein
MVLSTRNYNAPAMRADLERWVTTYRQTFTAVIDGADEPRLASQMTWGPRDTAFVVDLSTMQIVARERNHDGMRSAAARAIPELLRRLRKE